MNFKGFNRALGIAFHAAINLGLGRPTSLAELDYIKQQLIDEGWSAEDIEVWLRDGETEVISFSVGEGTKIERR